MQPVRSSNLPLRWSGEAIPSGSVYKHVAPSGACRFPSHDRRPVVPQILGGLFYIHATDTEHLHSPLSRVNLTTWFARSCFGGMGSRRSTSHTLWKINQDSFRAA
jgi:hypothetical protein